jgi:hypothetical protein
MARSHQQETMPFHSSRPPRIAKSVTAMLVSVAYARWDGGVEKFCKRTLACPDLDEVATNLVHRQMRFFISKLQADIDSTNNLYA